MNWLELAGGAPSSIFSDRLDLAWLGLIGALGYGQGAAEFVEPEAGVGHIASNVKQADVLGWFIQEQIFQRFVSVLSKRDEQLDGGAVSSATASRGRPACNSDVTEPFAAAHVRRSVRFGINAHK